MRTARKLTKELKKKHLSRQVGGMEESNWGRGYKARRQLANWAVSHICVWINQEEQLGSETDRTTQGSGVGK